MNKEWDIAESTILTPENCRFYRSPTGLLKVSVTDPPYEGRAILSRAFPFEMQEEYLSVQNEEKEEKGMIRRLSDFDEATQAEIREELRKKYYAPKIKKILSLTERHGNSNWDCETDVGKLSFSVKDTYRSLIRITPDRLYVCDVDGCRYEIESVKALDRRSYSKIDLYL